MFSSLVTALSKTGKQATVVDESTRVYELGGAQQLVARHRSSDTCAASPAAALPDLGGRTPSNAPLEAPLHLPPPADGGMRHALQAPARPRSAAATPSPLRSPSACDPVCPEQPSSRPSSASTALATAAAGPRTDSTAELAHAGAGPPVPRSADAADGDGVFIRPVSAELGSSRSPAGQPLQRKAANVLKRRSLLVPSERAPAGPERTAAAAARAHGGPDAPAAASASALDAGGQGGPQRAYAPPRGAVRLQKLAGAPPRLSAAPLARPPAVVAAAPHSQQRLGARPAGEPTPASLTPPAATASSHAAAPPRPTPLASRKRARESDATAPNADGGANDGAGGAGAPREGAEPPTQPPPEARAAVDTPPAATAPDECRLCGGDASGQKDRQCRRCKTLLTRGYRHKIPAADVKRHIREGTLQQIFPGWEYNPREQAEPGGYERTDGLRTCRVCEKDHPVTAYHANKCQKDGISRHCKSCVLILNRAFKLGLKKAQVKELMRTDKAKDVPGLIVPFAYDACRPPEAPEGQRICRACGATKPLEAFVRNAKSADGISSYCWPCWTVLQKSRTDKLTLPDVQKAVETVPQLSLVSDDPAATKICDICYNSKPLTTFGRAFNRPDGHVATCKPCTQLERQCRRLPIDGRKGLREAMANGTLHQIPGLRVPKDYTPPVPRPAATHYNRRPRPVAPADAPPPGGADGGGPRKKQRSADADAPADRGEWDLLEADTEDEEADCGGDEDSGGGESGDVHSAANEGGKVLASARRLGAQMAPPTAGSSMAAKNPFKRAGAAKTLPPPPPHLCVTSAADPTRSRKGTPSQPRTGGGAVGGQQCGAKSRKRSDCGGAGKGAGARGRAQASAREGSVTQGGGSVAAVPGGERAVLVRPGEASGRADCSLMVALRDGESDDSLEEGEL